MNASRTTNSFLILALIGAVSSCSGGGGGGGGPAGPDPVQSSFVASANFGTRSNGVEQVDLTVVVADKKGNPLEGIAVEFRASGLGHAIVQPLLTDAAGFASGSITSTAAQAKSIVAVASPGADERELGTLSTEFVEVLPNSYYVRASGSDAASGTSPLEAWQTLPWAISQVGAGDTLYVGAGTYEPIEITVDAPASQRLVLRGDREGTFTGDAGDVLIDAAGGTHGIRFDHASNVTVRGFSIFGAQPGLAAGGGIWIEFAKADYLSIVECSLFENDRGIHAEAARGLLVEGSRISMNTGDGIVFGYTEGASVLNNLIYGNGGSGLALEDTSTVLTVSLNTFYQNEGHQLDERVGGSEGEISGNVLADGGSAALGSTAPSNLFPRFNLFWGNTSGASNRALPPDPTSVTADPYLSATAGADGVFGGFGAWDDDFRAANGSGAFDAGEGNARDLILPFGGSFAALTTRTNGRRDGEAPDADAMNLGYHTRTKFDAVPAAEAGDARLAYVLPEQAIVRTRTRSVDGTWTPTAEVHSANSRAHWVVHRAAPGRADELTAVLAESQAGAQLFLRRWNGRRWSEEQLPIATLQSANAGERGFDIEFESSSGDALVVYSNNDENPVFRTLVNGTLSAAAPVFPNPLGAGTVLWVELVAETGSDRIAMVALDDQSHLTASVWNGSAWTDPILLETNVVVNREFQAFDAAWESLSGDLLVVWGFSVFAEQARIATLDSSGWDFSVHTSAEAIGAVVRLASDPMSDQIVTAFGEGREDDDVTVAMWDGNAYVHTAEVTLQGASGQNSIDVGWIGNTGRAFATWRDQGSSGVAMVARFKGSWKIEGELTAPGVGEGFLSEIQAIPGTDRAEVVFMDVTGSLFHFEVTWNGLASVWTLKNGGQALDTGFDMMAPTKSFSLDAR